MSEFEVTPEKITAWKEMLGAEIKRQSSQYQLANLRYDEPFDAFEWAVRSTKNPQIGITGQVTKDTFDAVDMSVIASLIITHCNKAVGLE